MSEQKNNINSIHDILGHKFPILDNGFICVVDYMGCDDDIANAARVSYGQGTKTLSQNEGLIRYLMRHHHTTPFEMCEIKLHLKMPIFVARQWMRHRTANINEISARYSIIPDEYYIPEIDRMATQSTTNNQGSGTSLSTESAMKCKEVMQNICADAFNKYAHLLEDASLTRELARTILPQSTYTEFFWKIDLHNLLHFIRLRADSHAQYEIRVYASRILEIIKLWVPIVHQAFIDYRVDAINLSRIDIEALREMIDQTKAREYISENADAKRGDVKEMCEKLKKLIGEFE